MRDFFSFLITIFYWLISGVSTPELPGALAVLKTVSYYLMIVIMNSCILMAWALYNQIRFRGKSRRKPLSPIGPVELAKLYNVEPQEVAEWQNLRDMVMYHDAHGNLVRIEPRQ
jgi:biofilm PGA synthesis protein PgaD